MEKEYIEEGTFKYDISLLVVAVVWGGGYVVTKNAVDHIDPIYLNFLRFFISTIITGVLFFPRMKKINMDNLKAGGVIGLAMFLGYIFQTVGIQYTTASNQAFITSSNVAMVPFVVWIMTKKKPDNLEILAAIMCFVGIAILSINEDLRFNMGDILTFISAICFAFHFGLIDRYAKNHDPIVLTAIQFGMVAILSLISCFIFKVEFTRITATVGKSLVYISLFNTVLGFVVQNIAQSKIPATRVAIFISLEAVFGAIFSIIFLKDPVTTNLLIGCSLIFIAIIITETKLKFLKTL